MIDVFVVAVPWLIFWPLISHHGGLCLITGQFTWDVQLTHWL